MATLSEIMLNPTNRPQVIRDCVQLLEDEVGRKSGLSGLAIKGGFSVIKKIKPTMVQDAMESLLDDFVRKLEPIHAEYEAGGRAKPLEQFLGSNSNRIANTLLSITDERAKKSTHTLLVSTYEKLRPMAVKQIDEAMPAVARLLKKYV